MMGFAALYPSYETSDYTISRRMGRGRKAETHQQRGRYLNSNGTPQINNVTHTILRNACSLIFT